MKTRIESILSRPDVQSWVEALGWGLLVLWFVLSAAIKIGLYRNGVAVGDIFLHANAMANSHFPGKLLYTAAYQVERGITSLLQDHFQPTSLLLIPLFHLFGTPIFLILIQALGPLFLVGALWVTGRRFGASRRLILAVALFTLYNAMFLKAVVDGPGGYRHDAQFLVYLPLFLASFLARRWLPTILFLFLYMGIKEDAAFYPIAFGVAVLLFGLPVAHDRRLTLTVVALATAYFILSVFYIPAWIHSPNIYVHSGMSKIGTGLIYEAVHGFIKSNWYNFYLYFIYVILCLPFFLAGALDVAVLSIMSRPASLYYDFSIVIFFAFGMLLVLTTLNRATGRVARIRRLLWIAFGIQLVVAVPVGLAAFHHTWRKSMEAAVTVPAADTEAAWKMVDKACTVSPADALLQRFYRLPYWVRPRAAEHARTVVMVDPELYPPQALWRDHIHGFVAANRARLRLVGRAGPVSVWLDPKAPCLP